LQPQGREAGRRLGRNDPPAAGEMIQIFGDDRLCDGDEPSSKTKVGILPSGF
jgi:hypothetical protein